MVFCKFNSAFPLLILLTFSPPVSHNTCILSLAHSLFACVRVYECFKCFKYLIFKSSFIHIDKNTNIQLSISLCCCCCCFVPQMRVCCCFLRRADKQYCMQDVSCQSLNIRLKVLSSTFDTITLHLLYFFYCVYTRISKVFSFRVLMMLLRTKSSNSNQLFFFVLK